MNRFYGWILSGMRPLPEGWLKRSRQAATILSIVMGLAQLAVGLYDHPHDPLTDIVLAGLIFLLAFAMSYMVFPLLLAMFNEIAHDLVIPLCRALVSMCKGLWWFFTHLPSLFASAGRAVRAMTWPDWMGYLLFAAFMLLLGVFYGLLWQPVGRLALHLPVRMRTGDPVEAFCVHALFTLYIATIPWAIVTATCTALLKRAIRRRKA